MVYSSTPWEARIYRVEVATGKRTLLQTVEPSERAGSTMPIRLAYAERSKTYVYSTVRILGIFYVVEGLEQGARRAPDRLRTPWTCPSNEQSGSNS